MGGGGVLWSCHALGFLLGIVFVCEVGVVGVGGVEGRWIFVVEWLCGRVLEWR